MTRSTRFSRSTVVRIAWPGTVAKVLAAAVLLGIAASTAVCAQSGPERRSGGGAAAGGELSRHDFLPPPIPSGALQSPIPSAALPTPIPPAGLRQPTLAEPQSTPVYARARATRSVATRSVAARSVARPGIDGPPASRFHGAAAQYAGIGRRPPAAASSNGRVVIVP